MLSSRLSAYYVRSGLRLASAAAAPQIPPPDRQPPIKFAKLFINNEWQDATSGKTIKVSNPATGKIIGEVQEASKSDVDKAVRAASDAFQFGSEWRRMDASKRGVLLNRLADAMEQNVGYLAALESVNSGIPYARACAFDVGGSASLLRYYAGWANKNHGKVIPVDGNYFCYTRHEPVGVCAQITPWNAPLFMCASKIAPALAMGNTVVLKPAEQTPLSSLYVAELCRQVGFPAGVVNIISGHGEAGAALVEHPEVNKVSFTGSTSVGQRIMASAAQHVKRVTLELGGKSPNIVLSDADFDAAIQYAHLAVYYNQGQVCCAGTRLFVEESIYDKFVERSVDLAKKRKVGDPFDFQVEQGPQVSGEQLQTILRYVNLGKQQGAKLCTGGERIGNEGYFMQPTVFADVKDDMTIAKEEIFGPVMSILKFKSLDEIIKRANNTPYGLAAGVFTKDIDKANHLVQGLRAGVVWVNCYYAADHAAPFGGYKMSGFGREGGEYGLQHYTEVKTVVMPVHQKNS